MAVVLKPHQEQAVKDLKNGCVLWGGVGSGKSITVIEYYLRNESTKADGTPRDIYVITTARKRDTLDWEKEFVKFGIYKSEDSTIAGVLHVDSWNNLSNYTDIHDAFFIFDEQRVVGAGAWTKAFLAIAKSNRWVLLSATPGDTWLDYVPVFLANGFYKNRTEFKREHVVYNTYSKFPKVDHYVGINKLVKLKNQVLVEMPYESHTVRHTKYIDVDHDKESFHKALVQRWHVFEQRPIRDVAELFMVMRKIVNGDPSRLDVVKCLMEQHPKLIIFYNFNYELEMLRTLASTEVTSRDISSEERSSSQKTSQSSSTPAFPDPITSRANDSLLERSSTASSERSPTTSGSGSRNSSSETDQKNNPDTPSSATGEAGSSRSTEKSGPPSSDSTESSSRKSTTSTTTSRGGLKSVPNLPSDSFAIAEWNGHKHEPIPDTDRWVYLVQYTAGAEGWNCTETDAMIFYSLTYSYKQWHQAFGRIDRLNTPYVDLFYYVLRSNSVIDRAILNSLKMKRAFNESSFGIKLAA